MPKKKGYHRVKEQVVTYYDRTVTMDLYKAIQDLYAEKEKLERVIASLEELQRGAGTLPVVPKAATRRGRKSMGSKERKEVSERMKKYWESRRHGGTGESGRLPS